MANQEKRKRKEKRCLLAMTPLCSLGSRQKGKEKDSISKRIHGENNRMVTEK